eukprot:m.2484 g.2484  ORF g.2484 m.2484 type:complete len:84 (+) comp2543_c0_seq1:454-705(+)
MDPKYSPGKTEHSNPLSSISERHNVFHRVETGEEDRLVLFPFFPENEPPFFDFDFDSDFELCSWGLFFPPLLLGTLSEFPIYY